MWRTLKLKWLHLKHFFCCIFMSEVLKWFRLLYICFQNGAIWALSKMKFVWISFRRRFILNCKWKTFELNFGKAFRFTHYLHRISWCGSEQSLWFGKHFQTIWPLKWIVFYFYFCIELIHHPGSFIYLVVIAGIFIV